jgi:hypothetical protein
MNLCTLKLYLWEWVPSNDKCDIGRHAILMWYTVMQFFSVNAWHSNSLVRIMCNLQFSLWDWNPQTVSVTLTLEVGTWIFDSTHYFDAVDVCANKLKSLNAWQCYSPDTKVWAFKFLLWKCDHIYINCKCDIDFWGRIFDTTQRLDVEDICTKLFENPLIHDKVTVPSRMSTLKLFLCKWVHSNYTCDLDLERRDVGLGRKTSSWCRWFLCKVIFKILQLWQCCSSDTNVCILYLSL